MNTPDIICIGEPMLEFNQQPAAIGSEGNLYLRGFGGDTSNCAIAAARQGANVGYITALGTDVFGQSFLDLWQQEGIDCRHVIRDPASHTAVYFVTHSPAGHAFHYLRAGSAASRMKPGDLPAPYIEAAKILQFSGISIGISASARDTCMAAMTIARTAGVKVAFDTNLRLRLWPIEEARPAIHACMAKADIGLPSLDDARELTGLKDATEIAAHYLDMGTGLVALKLGADGVLIADKSGMTRLPGHRVAAVDATGAGDAFDGAFLARLVAGDSAIEAAIYANAAAALAVTGFGAVAPIPRQAEVLEQMRRITD